MTSPISHTVNTIFSRRRSTKLMISFTAALMVLLVLFGSIEGNSYTGGQAGNCTCHGPEGTDVTITIEGLPETDGYEPESEYSVTVTASREGISTSGGIWITADKGVIKAVDATLQESSGDLVHHGTATTSWSFNWTAPAANSGQATIKVVALVGDGSSTSGDAWSESLRVITQKVDTNQTNSTDTTPPPPPPSPPNFTNDIILYSIFGTGITIVVFALVVGADIRDRRKNE